MSNRKFSLYEKIVSRLYLGYIEYVVRTSQIVLEGDASPEHLKNSIIGFWHGNSFAMNFLLREMRGKGGAPQVIITADKRGNYIEQIIKHYEGDVLRMPDGMAMRSFFRELKEAAKIPNGTLCVALDGPLGPYKDPKKLGAMLSYESQKRYILMDIQYSRKMSLTKRWDDYVVPLPFGKITFRGYDMGVITKQQLRGFELYKQAIKEILQ